jgi:iron complex transport system substrate-binding protein
LADAELYHILKQKTLSQIVYKNNTIQVPLQSIVVTSTTIIPYLELLGVENRLAGFPNTNFISSKKTRKLIDNNTVKDVGQMKLNIEMLIEMSPELIVTFGIDNNNQQLIT